MFREDHRKAGRSLSPASIRPIVRSPDYPRERNANMSLARLFAVHPVVNADPCLPLPMRSRRP